MIREVLPSDVEFARGMMGGHHSDAEILAILHSRGVEPGKAAQLLDDLQHGRKPETHLPYSAASLSAGPQTHHRTGAAVVHTPASSKSHHPHRSRRGSGPSWWFLLLVVIFVWAIGYAFLHLGSDASQDVIQKVRHEVPPPPNKQ